MDDSAVLVFLSLSLMSWRSASRSLPSGFSSFDATDAMTYDDPESLYRIQLNIRNTKIEIYFATLNKDKLTCTFPWFTVLGSVPGNPGGTSAAMTLFWLVIILIR